MESWGSLREIGGVRSAALSTASSAHSTWNDKCKSRPLRTPKRLSISRNATKSLTSCPWANPKSREEKPPLKWSLLLHSLPPVFKRSCSASAVSSKETSGTNRSSRCLKNIFPKPLIKMTFSRWTSIFRTISELWAMAHQMESRSNLRSKAAVLPIMKGLRRVYKVKMSSNCSIIWIKELMSTKSRKMTRTVQSTLKLELFRGEDQ